MEVKVTHAISIARSMGRACVLFVGGWETLRCGPIVLLVSPGFEFINQGVRRVVAHSRLDDELIAGVILAIDGPA